MGGRFIVTAHFLLLSSVGLELKNQCLPWYEGDVAHEADMLAYRPPLKNHPPAMLVA